MFFFSSERGVPAYAKAPPPDLSSGDVVLSVAKSAEAAANDDRTDVGLSPASSPCAREPSLAEPLP